MNNSEHGIITRQSKYSVKEALDKFEELLSTKGIAVFTRIDQRAEAKKVGMDLPPTELIVFGNPRAGTPIMAAFPLAALDLPLKLLAWGQDDTVWLAYNDPAYLQQRFALPDEMAKKIDFRPLVDQIAIGS